MGTHPKIFTCEILAAVIPLSDKMVYATSNRANITPAMGESRQIDLHQMATPFPSERRLQAVKTAMRLG